MTSNNAPPVAKSKKISDKDVDFALAIGSGINMGGIRALLGDRIDNKSLPSTIKRPKSGPDIRMGGLRRFAYKHLYGKKSIPRVGLVTGVVGTGLAYGGLRYQRRLYEKMKKKRETSLLPPIRKMAGGPGSSISHENTEKIDMEKFNVSLSPLVTIGKRKRIMDNPNLPSRDMSLDPRQIDYLAQEMYVVTKLANLLKDKDGGWTRAPIQVLKVGEDYHLMDGHHRWLASRRLGHNHLQARVWEMDLGDVKEALNKNYSLEGDEEMKTAAAKWKMNRPALISDRNGRGMKKSASKIPSPLLFGAAGATGLGGLSILKQKGENYASGDHDRKVNPYRVVSSALLGGGLGFGASKSIPAIREMTGKMDGRLDKLMEHAGDLSESGNKALKRIRKAVKNADETLTIVKNAPVIAMGNPAVKELAKKNALKDGIKSVPKQWGLFRRSGIGRTSRIGK